MSGLNPEPQIQKVRKTTSLAPGMLFLVVLKQQKITDYKQHTKMLLWSTSYNTQLTLHHVLESFKCLRPISHSHFVT